MRIKICGLTDVADAVRAAELGADALGLNFYPSSKRHISAATARAILAALPPAVEPVGLFVNRPVADLTAWLAAERLSSVRTVQLHADAPEVLPESPLRFLPAFSVRDRDHLRNIESFLRRCREKGTPPAAVLLDAHVAGEYGGTGRTAPWDLLADFRPGVPVVLAGGLTPDNVAAAIRAVRPQAVDVASGVESAPGRKDADKMKRFIAAAREAFAAVAGEAHPAG